MKSGHLVTVLLVVSGLASVTATTPRAEAADVTNVIDAFDGDKAWDGILALRFVHRQISALITREQRLRSDDLDAQYQIMDARQLRSKESFNLLNIDLRAGLYHDLEFYMTLPLVLGWSSSLEHDEGVGSGNSLVDSSAIPSLFSVPYESPNRIGLGDISLGLKVAPFHYDRDKLNPSWVLGIEYQAPTGTARVAGAEGVGRGLHELEIYTAISRRVVRWADPYVRLHGRLRFPGSDSPFQNERITQTLVSPGHSLGLRVGTEFYPWLTPSDTGQFVAIDIGFVADFTFEGREFTELYDALGTSGCDPKNNCHRTRYTRGDKTSEGTRRKTDGITDVEQYGRFGLQLGVTYQPLQFLQVRLGFNYLHTTGHFLTFADAGKDLDGSGEVTSPNNDGLNEYNPFFNKEYDEFGHRFRVDDKHSYEFVLSIQGQL